jgi:hypothetical protein
LSFDVVYKGVVERGTRGYLQVPPGRGVGTSWTDQGLIPTALNIDRLGA